MNTRVAVLVDGARYGGRVDDVVDGALVVAAPDLSLSVERPVIVEWRDAAGTWQLPGEVSAQRLYPFPTTSVRPTGPSECIAAPAVDAGLRVAARVIDSGRLPEGTRVPVTTLNLRLNEDGTLAANPRMVRQSGVTDENDRYRQRVVDLGVAAFKGCSPLKLPAEYYSTPSGGWNNINFQWKLQ